MKHLLDLAAGTLFSLGSAIPLDSLILLSVIFWITFICPIISVGIPLGSDFRRLLFSINIYLSSWSYQIPWLSLLGMSWWIQNLYFQLQLNRFYFWTWSAYCLISPIPHFPTWILNGHLSTWETKLLYFPHNLFLPRSPCDSKRQLLSISYSVLKARGHPWLLFLLHTISTPSANPVNSIFQYCILSLIPFYLCHCSHAISSHHYNPWRFCNNLSPMYEL